MPLSVKPVDESIPSIVLFEFCVLVFTPSPALGNRLPDVAAVSYTHLTLPTKRIV